VPFNGAGMFVRLRNWVEDATAGIKIRADYHDIEDDNFATGISQCIARDGQSTVLQNIPMNSKRLTALSDPVDPQDAATRAYADLKLPLTGGTLTGRLTVTAGVAAQGYLTRQGYDGSNGANWFNFNYTGNLEAWVDNTNLGALATQAYVEQRAQDWAHAIADPKVNRAGDTMSGLLSTAASGNLGAGGAMNSIQVMGSASDWAAMTFHSPGAFACNFGLNPNGDFYCGGYSFGAGVTYKFWTTRNLNPIQNGRLVAAGDIGPGNGSMNEPAGGAVLTGLSGRTVISAGADVLVVTGGRLRYLQLLTPGGWYTVSYA
jgi:hypothetical protein